MANTIDQVSLDYFRSLVAGIRKHEEFYRIDRKRERKGLETLGLSKSEDSLSKHETLLDNFEKLKESATLKEELYAMSILIKRVGKYPKLLPYDNKTKEMEKRFEKSKDEYEDKYADKRTRRLIEEARRNEKIENYRIRKKIKNTKFKESRISMIREGGIPLPWYDAFGGISDSEKQTIWSHREWINVREYKGIINSLADKMKHISQYGKGEITFNTYFGSVDMDTHESRIEKAISLSDKAEKTLESIFNIYIPSDIREEFTERDLKVFEAYSKKMREAVEKVKEFDIEMAEYQLAEERSETALDELTEMHSIPDKMRYKIRNSIKAHETKLSKSRRKLEEKKEKHEEKTGIKNELGRVGHYRKLLELHQKYADITITEEKLLAEADCSIRIDDAKKELEEIKRKAPSEERDQEIEKIESKISWDKARLKEFKETREGVAEYKGMMKDFVEDTIARARGKDKITTKALPVGKVETKEQDKKEEKSNIDIFRENMNKSMEARRARESSLRERKQDAREEKTSRDVKNKDNDKYSKNDVGGIE